MKDHERRHSSTDFDIRRHRSTKDDAGPIIPALVGNQELEQVMTNGIRQRLRSAELTIRVHNGDSPEERERRSAWNIRRLTDLEMLVYLRVLCQEIPMPVKLEERLFAPVPDWFRPEQNRQRAGELDNLCALLEGQIQTELSIARRFIDTPVNCLADIQKAFERMGVDSYQQLGGLSSPPGQHQPEAIR